MELSLSAIKANCEIVGKCWEWRGYMKGSSPTMTPTGAGKGVSVRRMVMQLSDIPLPDGRLACASCRSERCVSPLCAVAMTRSEIRLRTAAFKTTHFTVAHKRKIAEAARSRSPLDEGAVQRMRESGLGPRAAAREFGCSHSTAASVLSRHTWKDYSNPFAVLLGRAV